MNCTRLQNSIFRRTIGPEKKKKGTRSLSKFKFTTKSLDTNSMSFSVFIIIILYL